MKKKQKQENGKGELLVKTILEAASEKKAKEIVCLDLRDISARVADYFIICHTDSGVHSQSVCEGIVKKVKETLLEKPISREGVQEAAWILLDYANVVVHVFQGSFRTYYNLEGLWADAVTTTYTEEPVTAQ
jgi:ribosome-associated protein